ncbi:phage tail tape measure protein [Bacillus spizizenii]|uniref:phage tail tape measure protein n=1 Tax=Bacillus spizizenii TaxID=96241 RepID=UPI002FCAC99E
MADHNIRYVISVLDRFSGPLARLNASLAGINRSGAAMATTMAASNTRVNRSMASMAASTAAVTSATQRATRSASAMSSASAAAATGLGAAALAADNAGQSGQTMSERFKNAKGAISATGKAVTVFGGLAAFGLGKAVATTANFESAMSRVGALSGATGKQLASLTETAEHLGATTSYSATEAAEGMQFLAMAGYKTNDIIAAMPGLLNAAAAGQTDLATTADITSNILSGFGLKAEETGRVADVLTKAFTSSNTTLEMLGYTMKYVAPVAKASGQSLESMAAAAGILGNAGIQADQAGTSLRMMLIRLARPPKMAREALEDLGVSVSDAEGNMKPLSQVIGELSKATEGMADADRLAAISKISGTEASAAMLALMDAGQGTIEKFTKELENSGGTAEEIATKQLDNLKGQLIILKSALEGAAIAIGSALMPAIKAITSVLQFLVDKFNGLPGPVKATIAVVAALAAVFALMAGPMLILVSMIPGIIAGFTAISAVLSPIIASFGAVAAVIAGVVAVVVAIGAALVIAYQKIDWFRNAVNEAWSAISSTFMSALNTIWSIIQTIFSQIMEVISPVLEQMRTDFLGTGMSIQTAITTAFTIIQTIIVAVIDFVRAFIVEGLLIISTFFDTHGEAISNAIMTAYNFISTTVTTILTAISEFVGSIVAKIQAFWDQNGAAIMAAVSMAWSFIQTYIVSNLQSIWGTVQMVLGLIKGLFQIVWPIISGIVQIAWATIKSYISVALNLILGLISAAMAALQGDWSGAWEAIKGIAQNIWNDITSYFESIDLYEIGANIIQGLIDGIASMASAVGDKISEIASGIPEGIKSFLGIHSPSRVMRDQVGRWIPAGLAEGIGAGASVVKRSVASMAALVPQSIEAPAVSMAYATPSVGSVSVGGTSVGRGSVAQATSKTHPIQIEVVTVMDGEVIGRTVEQAVSAEQGRKITIKNLMQG